MGTHARIQNVLPEGLHFFDKRKEHPNSTKSGPSSAGGPMMALSLFWSLHFHFPARLI